MLTVLAIFRCIELKRKSDQNVIQADVEVGRWKKPVKIPYDNRLCTLCHKLEDEFHFSFECNRYRELRSQYIPKRFWERPNMFKFVELFSSTNEIILRNLGMYTFKAFKVRNVDVFQ